MENRASYTLVGAFVLAVILAGAAFAVWLARYELKEERTFYYIYVRGSVAGLSEGSSVRLRGVPVGTVTGIAIDQRNVELIEVTIALKAGTPVRTDTTATLASQGITGVSYVSLTGGSNAAPPLLPREGKRRATIPSVASPLEKLFEEAPNVIASASIVAARAAALAPRPALDAPSLASLAALDDTAFRALFAGTPIKRTGRDRFLRNVLIAIGNSGEASLVPAAEARLGDASPLVRAMAVWALARLLPSPRFAALRAAHRPAENDPAVSREWDPVTAA